MEINAWVTCVHALAVEKGWHLHTESEMVETGKISVERKLSLHMLIVTEVVEATEEVRNIMPDFYWKTPTGIVSQKDVGDSYNLSIGLGNETTLQKPEGEQAELADVVIRVMDYFGLMGWDLDRAIKSKHDYNKSRALRHGGKAI